MGYKRPRDKQKTHANNKRKAKVIYPKANKPGCGFAEEMVLLEDVEQRVNELQRQITKDSDYCYE